MTSLQELLRRAAHDLDALGFGWALVGGLAVSARTQPRFTADVDLAVAVSGDQQAEALVRALGERGWLVDALVEQDSAKRLATVRLVEDDAGGPIVDLLFASSGIEPEIVQTAETLEVFPGYQLRVARTGHLIAVKLLARSEAPPQDDADLRSLVAVADEADLTIAAAAVELIEQRGFARGRALSSALAEISGP